MLLYCILAGNKEGAVVWDLQTEAVVRCFAWH